MMHHDNKKFCIFSAQYLPHMGGVERYTYYLAKELVRDGNSVVIVTSLSPGLKEREETDGIKIYRLPSFNFMDGRMPVLKPGKALRQAENELKRQRAQIEEKNRLMDEMIALVQPQLFQINRLLEEENAQILNVQNLKQVCLLGAYVKRRVNLALTCDQKTVVPVDELIYCIRESLTYLPQYGAVCALHQEGKGNVRSRDAQTAYDFFEDCLEAALPSLSALMVRVECGERFSVRLMMEDAAGLPKADKYRALGKLTIDDADGALCATLSPDWGGVRA